MRVIIKFPVPDGMSMRDLYNLFQPVLNAVKQNLQQMHNTKLDDWEIEREEVKP